MAVVVVGDELAARITTGGWVEKIRAAAARHGLRPELVAALVWQESGFRAAAVRPEPGFFIRYKPAIVAFVQRSKSKTDDHWLRFPEFYSASYGPMQVLYQVALEHGFTGDFPTELCVPEVGLDFGCRVFVAKMKRTGDLRAALLAYNGGGRPAYADEVLAKQAALAARGLFR